MQGHLVVFPLSDWRPVIPPMATAVSLGWGRARKGPMWPLRGGNLSWAAGHRVVVGMADTQKVWAVGIIEGAGVRTTRPCGCWEERAGLHCFPPYSPPRNRRLRTGHHSGKLFFKYQWPRGVCIFSEFNGNIFCKKSVLCLVAQSCPTVYDPMDCSPPGSSVHGILQAGILEWVAMPSARGSSQPRDGSQVSCIAGGFFTIWATRESLVISLLITKGQDTFYKIKIISETFFTACWAF